jgi:6,7-dimethyl-8-ribityllumazine synthase
MGKVYEGRLFISKENKIGIVVSRFNKFISERLLDGAIDRLKRSGAAEENIDVFWVPGAFEIPVVLSKLARSKKYDGVICLGVVIQGDTPHYEYIASEVTKGIAKIMLETGVPVSFGILTTDNIEQAIERAGAKAGNKGAQAAEAVIELINLFAQMK